jgi:hypothetical protein
MVRYVESIAIQRRLFVTNRVWISPVVEPRKPVEQKVALAHPQIRFVVFAHHRQDHAHRELGHLLACDRCMIYVKQQTSTILLFIPTVWTAAIDLHTHDLERRALSVQKDGIARRAWPNKKLLLTLVAPLTSQCPYLTVLIWHHTSL